MLSTPSLGITNLISVLGKALRGLLSTPSLGITKRVNIFIGEPGVGKSFNSLSRDHMRSTITWLERTLLITFNSLSRDHTGTPGSRGTGAPSPLSTPSLGITYRHLIARATQHKNLSTPSLGITFAGLRGEGRCRLVDLSTPSLGITFQFCRTWNHDVGLSTPSLGITGSAVSLTFGFPVVLSTPSLGITEPDSGIFRLSAAFCRGTSSHK